MSDEHGWNWVHRMPSGPCVAVRRQRHTIDAPLHPEDTPGLLDRVPVAGLVNKTGDKGTRSREPLIKLECVQLEVGSVSRLSRRPTERTTTDLLEHLPLQKLKSAEKVLSFERLNPVGEERT